MNISGHTSSTTALRGVLSPRQRWLLGALLLGWASACSLLADATVKTLGGGRLTPTGPDAGFADGNTLQLSQFNTPSGCAVDASGRVFVADRNNGALRRLDVAANRCRTILTGLADPVAVAIDTNNTVYILTRGNGGIQKLQRGVATTLTAQLSAPTALAYDGHHSLFVTQSAGTVVQVDTSSGSVSPPLISGLNQPGGIAVLDSGWVAISETGANLVRIWNPTTGSAQLQIGTGQAGFVDGPAAIAQFNRPSHVAKAPGGSLLVADRGNQRGRLIDPSGFVSTFYGVDSAAWEGPACTTCDPIILPGWLDGSAEFAEAREPVGVAVGADGSIYTTEVYYHVVRQISGATFFGDNGTGSTNIVVLPPVIDPVSGYFPMGQTITVLNPNSGNFLPTAIYYTTDGSEPTTNSLAVSMNGGAGTIFWQEKAHDLSSLRVKAFLGNNASPTVSGQSVAVSELGVPQDIAAGVGSTVIVPVVLNLATNQQVQSLQFRIEIAPLNPGAPMIPDTLRAIGADTNDFIPLYSGGSSKGNAQFSWGAYNIDQTRGVAVSYIGTNAHLQIQGFAAPGLLAVPISPQAHVGDRYSIQVLNPSGTADAGQQRVPIVAMDARTIIITNTSYLIGDSSTAVWYNAAQFDLSGASRRGFGDGLLENSDVNNAFAASLGVRVPFPNTDVFDAMDAYPEDTATAVGGDGAIRYLDWQVILMRSLGLDLARWERTWSDAGVRVASGPSSGGLFDTPGQILTATAPGDVWTKQVTLSARPMEQVTPGVPFDIPVYIQIAPGCQLAGLAFRTVLEPDGGAPPLDMPVQFIPSPDLPAPPQNSVPSANTALCGWPLVPASSFDPPLRGSNFLGYVRVTLPLTAQRGQSYQLKFANADGSPDLQTQYNFDTLSAAVWVLSPALQPSSATPDDWKLRFFGSTISDASRDDADPDRDGVPNWLEYLAGTDPNDGHSYLHLTNTAFDLSRNAVELRWLSAPGKTYQIEAASSLLSPSWQVVASGLVGDGNLQQWKQTNVTGKTQFYRLGVQP